MRLAQLGRRIEAHFGCPQDIEWCLVDDDFQIVQSRPITTLFPIPAADDGENHVYLSVGHQQMMTDPMKPLGLSVWQLTRWPPMHEAGGRLFVDVTQALASPARPRGLLELMGKSDPLIRDALETVLDRRRLHHAAPGRRPCGPPAGGTALPDRDRSGHRRRADRRSQASIAALKPRDPHEVGVGGVRLHPGGHPELKRVLSDPQSHQAFMAAMEATWWLNEQLQEWLGEKNAADTLTPVRPPQRHLGDGTGAPGRR